MVYIYMVLFPDVETLSLSERSDQLVKLEVHHLALYHYLQTRLTRRKEGFHPFNRRSALSR